MLKAARELLAVRSPLDAELMVSELLGTWWGQQGGRRGARRRADIEELVGEGLVSYAASQGSPAALALLSGIACLGTPRQAAGVVVDDDHQGVLLLAGVAEDADDLVPVAVGIGVDIALGGLDGADVLGPGWPGHPAIHEGERGLLGLSRLAGRAQARDAR